MKLLSAIRESILTNLSRQTRKKGLWIIVLMAINAALDFFSMAALLPLLIAVVDPKVMFDNFWLKESRFTSHAVFVVTMAIAVVFFILFKNLGSLWIAKVKARYAFGIRNELSSRALLHHLGSSYLQFTKLDFSVALNRITHYPLAFANYIVIPLATIVSEILVSIFILACVLYFDYAILGVICLILLPIVVIIRFRRKKLSKISHEIKTNYPIALKYSNQAIEAFAEINSYQKTLYFHERFRRINKRLSEVFVQDHILHAGTHRITELMVALVVCSIVIYSVVARLPVQQTLVLLGVYAGAGFRLIPSINRILHAIQQINTNQHVLEDLKIPLQTKQADTTLTGPLIFSKTIAFKNISYAYPEGQQILNNLSFIINKGERVAITGASGEGKTTVLLVLLGLLHPDSGSILVDGEPIQNHQAWKTLIGYVPQHPYMLDASIAENIAFGIPADKINPARIQQLIQNLGLATVINQLPHGVNTKIGERGIKLSGGQRQRVSIARALYANTEILLLDEVTNQIDGARESEVLTLLENVAHLSKTIIMVTHKLPKNSFFNSIFELKGNTFHHFQYNEEGTLLKKI